MKKVVLFILILIFFSYTADVLQSSDFAIRVGDHLLTHEELDDRYYEKHHRDRDRTELLNNFLNYVLMNKIAEQRGMEITEEDIRDRVIELYQKTGQIVPGNPVEQFYEQVDKTWDEYKQDLWTGVAKERFHRQLAAEINRGIREEGEEFVHRRVESIHQFYIEHTLEEEKMSYEEMYDLVLEGDLESVYNREITSNRLASLEGQILVSKVSLDLEIEISPQYEDKIETEIPTR